MKYRVLVLCTGNSCRSQMAEGWLRHDLGEKVEVFSAGTHPSFVHPLAIAAMGDAGVELSHHRSKSVGEFVGQSFDLVITVCDSAAAACPVLPGAQKIVHEPLPDPVAYGSEGRSALEKFKESRDLVRERVVARVRRELGLEV